MESSISRGSFRATVQGEHRTGKCENCGSELEKKVYPEKPKVRLICPKCGGQGRLIARLVSIQAPTAPQCLKVKCLTKFFLAIVFCGLLSTYHRKRVAYAEKNRHANILQKYRTGDDSPSNIRQAIFAIIKLSIRR